MKVFDLYDSEGRLLAFEIDNIGRWVVTRLLVSLGAKVTRKPRLLSWFREEEFCEFTLHDKRFVVWEPFGDSSRYHIGQNPAGACEEIKAMRDAFASQPLELRFMLPRLERPGY